MSLLQNVVSRLLKESSADFSNFAIVFPNKRAGLFFKKLLAQQIEKPVWAPAVLSLSELVEKISPYESLDKFSLIYRLYQIMSKYYQENETFERFFFWGETLIVDFDEADKFLMDAKLLLQDLSHIKDLEGSLAHLNKEQIELLKRYWKNFSKALTREQEQTLSIWKILYPTYEEFTASLRKEGKAYPGMMYKWVAENLGKTMDIPYRKIIFAGFNALSASEEKLITWCCQNKGSEVFWDADDYYLNDEFQEGGKFLRHIKRSNPVLAGTFQPAYPGKSFENRRIDVVECSSDVGQAQEAGRLLESLLQQHADPEKTAVILPNEKLLLPILGAIPESANALNITMGYSLQNSLAYGFLLGLIDLQKNISTKNGTCFYYKDVINVLSHPFVFSTKEKPARQIIQNLKEKNVIFPSPDLLLVEDESLRAIFREVKKAPELIGYLQDNLLAAAEVLEDDNFESEFIFHFYKLLNNLKAFLENTSFEIDLKTFTRLINHSIYRERAPFEGEPLKGLQIMGFMETRNLSFENVILLSANEGVLPPAKQDVSFIPYSIRRVYGLPTIDHSDAIFSYLFYRLIHNARNVTIIYNSNSEKGNTGELSRFVRQLDVESNITINYKTQENDIFPFGENKIAIRKTPEVLQRLGRYLVDNGNDPEKRFSPSAFSTFLDCPLRFYFKYVLDLYEEDEIEEDIRERELGNIFHRAIEIIYRDFDNDGKRSVTQSDIQAIIDKAEQYTDAAFHEHFGVAEGSPYDFRGQTDLARDIVKTLVLRVLEIDLQYAPFDILGVEANDRKGFKLDLDIGGKQKVGIKGVIDRIDKKEGTVRIIDYKTGKDKSNFADIPSLFNPENKNRNKAVFQTFLYGMIFQSARPGEDGVLEAGLFNLREMFKDEFNTKISLGPPSQKNRIHDIRPFLEEYKNQLSGLLQNIYDPDIDFVQTEDLKKCGYCPYNDICNKEKSN